MSKRRHNQDKMWITAKEHALDWGGKSEELERRKQSMIKLPFDYCNLGLQPAKDPMCTTDGIVFDLINIVPYLRKNNNVNPCTG